MKSYILPLGRTAEYVHPAPDRTASRSLPGVFGEIEFKVWPNRASMLKTIEMQERRERRNGDWRPLQR